MNTDTDAVQIFSAQLPLTFDAPRTATVKRSAADEIRRILMEVLPAGVPPSFGRITALDSLGRRAWLQN